MRLTSVLTATLLVQTSFAGQLPQNPAAVFQSQSHEVLLEVIVRDAHGKLVTKIDPSQVSVYEDGVRQDLRSFRLVPGSEVRAQYRQQLPQAEPAPAEANAKTVASVQSNPLRTVNVICLILNDLTPDTRAFGFDAARKFVDKELRPDTYIGVFSLDATGMRPVYPFSNSRQDLVHAIELATVNQLPATAQSTAATLSGLNALNSASIGLNLNLALSGASPAGAAAAAAAGTASVGAGTADGSSAADPLGPRGDIGVAVNAGLREIDALTRLVKQLSQLPFQKTVLLMSSGLTRPPDQLDYWNALIKSANQGGVIFYGVDVWGLGVAQDAPDIAGNGTLLGASGTSAAAVGLLQTSASLSSNQSKVGQYPTGPFAPGGRSVAGVSPTAQMAEASHQTDYLRFGVLSANTQEALREISESTGGFVIANTNNTEALLTKVMEDVDTHFELSYQPAAPSSDGHFHKIEVKISGKDLRVQTRNGYYAVPDTGEGPLTPGDMGALEALDAKPLPHSFDFSARAYRFRPAQATTQYSIAWEVPIVNLTATTDGKKNHHYHAYLLALVKNERGDIVERVSKDVLSEVPDNVATVLRNHSMIYEHAVNLSPGRYTIETAVVDQEANRASTNVFKVDNLEQPGPAVSDIALLRRVNALNRAPDPADPFEIPGKRGQPFLATTLPAGAEPYIYFVVYPGKDEAELRVQFLKNGRVMATQKSTLPFPDASGVVPMAIQAASGPGEYEVRVTVQQNRRVAQRALKYSIAAN